MCKLIYEYSTTILFNSLGEHTLYITNMGMYMCTVCKCLQRDIITYYEI